MSTAYLIALAVLPTLAGWLLGKWKQGSIATIAVWPAGLAGAVFAVIGAASGNQMAFALSYAFFGATAGLLGARLLEHSMIASLMMSAFLAVAFFGCVFIFGVTVGCAWSAQCP
jgi:hypothetical protein